VLADKGGVVCVVCDGNAAWNAKCTMYPPNVHRGQISKIWPDFRNLTRGVYLWPPQMSNIPPS
jgi:hypothetical protein